MGSKREAKYLANFVTKSLSSKKEAKYLVYFVTGGTIMLSAIPKIAIPRNRDPHPKSTKMRSEKY